MNPNIPQAWDISTAIASGDAIAFVGAGLSSCAGLPLWSSLATEFKRELRIENDENDPVLLAQYYRNEFGDHKLFTRIRSLIAINGNGISSEAHKTLCSLPFKVFVTTNYDVLLESTLRSLSKQVHVISDDRELAFWNDTSEVQVLKLHGDIDRSASLVVSEEDYVRFINENTGLQHKLVDLFRYRTIIFIGFGLRDPNISYIYNTVLYELGKFKKKAFVLTFESDRHVLREWERKLITPVIVENHGGENGRTNGIVATLRLISDQVHALNSLTTCDVLIVDDEPMITSLVSTLCELNSLSVQTAMDGMAASLAIGKLKPKIVWVDLMMPRMGGFELIQIIRRDQDLKDIKIIICTGHSSPESEKLASDLRVDEYLLKPFNMKTALAAISKCLGRNVTKIKK